MDVPDARDTIVADQPCLVAVNTSICDEKPSIENYLLSAAIRSHFEEWSGGFPPESEREIFVYVEYAQEEENADLVQKVLRGWMAGDEPTIQNCKTS